MPMRPADLRPEPNILRFPGLRRRSHGGKRALVLNFSCSPASLPMIPVRTSSLRTRLEEMLCSIKDAPVPVDGAAIGLLIRSPQIADFELELRREATPVGPRKMPPAHKSKAVAWKAFLMLSIVFAVVVFVVAQKGKHGDESPPPDKLSKSERQKPLSEGQDWSFLSVEGDWRNLAQFTGLRSDWDRPEVTLWAASLLRAADPDWGGTVATPDELKQNDRVKALFKAVQSAHLPSPHGAESVSNAWLGSFPENDRKGLSDFWKALEDRKIGTSTKLKRILIKWEQALSDLSRNDLPELAVLRDELQPFTKIESQRATGVSETIQILVETDRRRFLRVDGFLTGDSFSKAVAEGSDSEIRWQSLDWPKRLDKLKKLSKDGNLFQPIQELCKKLSDAVE